MADSQWLEPSERVKVEGLRDLIKALRKVDADLPAMIRQINKDAAEDVATAARTLVPRRSGNLADSIRSLASQRSGQVAAGKASVPYAGPIHFGWLRRHIIPQPFLYDALDQRRDKVFEAYQIQLEKLLDESFRGNEVLS